jgi:hypothetical protein
LYFRGKNLTNETFHSCITACSGRPFCCISAGYHEKGRWWPPAFEKGEKVFFYQSEPKNHKGKYERLHYIHPLWAPDGAALTEDFPADHLHHRGVFWAWHQVWIGDKKLVIHGKSKVLNSVFLIWSL